MKKHILSLVLAVITTAAFSQGKGKISGTIVDSSNNQPVEFATVALNDPETGKPVDGTIADDKGKFSIKGIENGSYVVSISFIGFETIKRTIGITDGNDNIELGTILFTPSVQVLQEITVEGQKALIEERIDRTIYNAENDLSARGGDAADVLRKVPLLSVDLDGNVSLRGSENIRVLINNRPSTITAGSVADALKQIPADDIKSVEVITSPSAKYDAEGTTGIINIITKKNVLEGATLNVNGSAGNRGSNLGLRGGYKQGKVGLSLGGWGRYGYNTLGNFENTQSTGDRVTIQGADTRSNYLRANYTLGFDYDFNEKNYITSSVRLGARGSKDYQDRLLGETFNSGILTTSTLRDVFSDNRSNSVDVNLNYTHLYDKKDKEWSLLGMYSLDDGTNDFENIILNPDLSTNSRLRNDNGNINEEFAIQSDFQTPINNNQLVEVGGKQTLRNVSSDYRYFTATGNDPYVLSSDQNLSNVFNYQQNVSAGYLSYTLNLKNYGFKAGGRYEYTTIDAFFQDEQNIEIPSYGAFVPSANISRKLKNNNMIKAAYNRRIQRPSIRFLNPNVQAANPLNITIGNPTLDPEFTDNYELSYSTFIKGTSLNFTGFARNTNNAIQRVSGPIAAGSDTLLTTFQNIGVENAYGMSINTNIMVGKKLMINGGTEVFYTTLTNNLADPNLTASNEGWVISGRLFGSYNLGKDWSAQFFSFARGRRVTLQGYQGGFGMYSLAFAKNLPNKRGSIGFGVENFLNPNITIKGETITKSLSPTGEYVTLAQQSEVVRQNLNVKVTLSLRFGKIEGSNGGGSRRSRRSISNDDLKMGEGGINDMGGQEQGGQAPGGFTPQRGGARPAAVPTGKADLSAVVDATGTWDYTIESPQGGSGVLKINKEGETFTGTIMSSRNNKEVAIQNVKLTGNELTFDYETSFGPNTATILVKGIIKENAFEGSMTLGQFGSFPMKATKK
ncbi:MAG: TonB-dependent receptor [Cyclobacteriaceae bacterium]